LFQDAEDFDSPPTAQKDMDLELRVLKKVFHLLRAGQYEKA
jgi:hypothetical protein